MFGIDSIKNLAVVAAAALAVGFTVGYATKGKFVKADQLETIVGARSETAADIRESLKVSVATEQEVTNSNQRVTDIRKAVAARVQPQPQPQEMPNEAQLRLACRDDGIDIGTVRLLNSARSGFPISPASFGDGASEAPSGIGLPELLDNDLEIVQLYHELAIRHDALVDYVEQLIERQADQ
ncbi:MAG: hypothetical protein FWF12_00570 [Betaproteobacteria bacterium]|nr:hypothetical protein [Betaproteobacteria bacterium]